MANAVRPRKRATTKFGSEATAWALPRGRGSASGSGRGGSVVANTPAGKVGSGDFGRDGEKTVTAETGTGRKMAAMTMAVNMSCQPGLTPSLVPSGCFIGVSWIKRAQTTESPKL